MSFAVAIPHTPWIPERVNSLGRVIAGIPGRPKTRIFQDKEPNTEWSKKVWAWGLESGQAHLLQLQDDAVLAPNFWPALEAMVEAVPDQIIGLQGAHPVFRTLAREEHHWARSHAWMVGVGYVIPRAALADLVKFREVFVGIAHEKNEDDFIAWFCTETGRDVWHPIPTILDHDTEIASTYGNAEHKFRRPTVTWREFGADEITRPDFWRTTLEPPMITNPHLNRCWFCQAEPSAVGFKETGALIGRMCLANGIIGALGLGGVKA